ncbi:hypothetical protein vseg_013337 [Gypsophila vaccaria]
MPLKRYEIRNEYSLADPELYKIADKDDPEAILEGVAMAGLVGVLRQLGDLAEFAAEIFHDLHEEVMSTAARGHGLIARVQQLEAEFPSVERKLLSQTSHTSFLYNSSIDWHSNPRLNENTITQGGLPRFVMDSYEECRGPPRLFLLDKFDVAGAGACLKRFTDPSFFKMESASSSGGKLERQREKKNRKVKKRGAHMKNGEPPDSFPSSHAKLHQLFLEERIENGGNDHDRRVKLKKRQFTGSLFDQKNTKSYMDRFLDTCPPEQRIVHEIYDPLPLTWTSNNASESSLEIAEIGAVSPLKESTEYDRGFCSSPEAGDFEAKPSIDEFSGEKSNALMDSEVAKVPGVNHSNYDSNADSIISLGITQVVNGEHFADRESKSEDSIGNSCDSDDVASEIDGYLDALASMDSEVDTDSDHKKNTSYLNLKTVAVDFDGSLEQREPQGEYMDSQSVGNSANSEDNFRERTNSSHSNSGTALAEITADVDTLVVADSSFPVSDNNNTFSAHHLVSKKITGTEPEEHAVAYMRDLRVNGGPKVGQEFDNVSDSSCLTDPNIKFLKRADSDDWSGEPSIHDETEHISSVCSDTSADARNTSTSFQIHSHDANSVCSPFEEHTTNILETSMPLGNKLQNAAPELSSSGIYEELEILGSGSLEAVGGNDSSKNIRRSDIASRHGDGELIDDCLIIGKPSSSVDLPSEEKHKKLQSEENDSDRDSILKSGPVSIVEVDRNASVDILDTHTACHDFTVTSPDQTTAVEMKAHLDHTLTEAVYILASSDHTLNEQIEDGNKVFPDDTIVSEVQYDHAIDSTAVTAVEDDVDLDFDVEKLEPVQALVACSRSANGEDDHDKKDDPSSSSTVYPEHPQDRLLVSEDNLNRDERTERQRAELTNYLHVNSVPDPHVDVNLNLCNTSNAVSPPVLGHSVVSQDLENSGKFFVHTPVASEHSYQNVESDSSKHHLLEVNDDNDSLRHAPLNEHGISSVQENFGKDIQTPEYVESGGYIASTDTAYSQSEPFGSIPPSQSAPSEYQTNLEAPPLPPLPPMQWRLGRFRNFSSAPERHMVQEQAVQVQPTHFAGVNQALGPGLTMNLPTVHYTLAPVQPAVLPAVHHTLIPVPQIPLTTLDHQTVSVAQTSRNEGQPGSSDGFVVLPGGVAVTIVASGSQGYSQSDMSAVGKQDNLIFSVPSTSGYMSWQGGSIMPFPATVSEGSSQDDRLLFAPSTSIGCQSSTHISEQFHQPNVTPPGSGTPDDGPAPDHNLAVVDPAENDDTGDDIGALIDQLVPKMTEQEMVSSSAQFQPLSTVHQPSAGFVASEAERTWLSTYDGIQTHTGRGTNGSLQKKLPRPRNPLIDEVVAIDKNKLRKVERVKPSLDSKAEEMESLLEQMQLRKVEKVKTPTETNATEGGYKMEHLQLRKVGERVKPLAEPKHDESEFLPEQLQLRKVGERFKAEIEHKVEETESPRVQLRKLSERVKPEVAPKTEDSESPRIQLRKVGERVKQEIEARTEETQTPRVQLRKVGENSQAVVVQTVEERDSLLEQIRNKSFSLKPAVAARPNIQGPRTNLKVAAILEKASNIRQAMVGSDEDDDADTWE